MGRHQKKLCSSQPRPRLCDQQCGIHRLDLLTIAKEIGEDKARRYLKQIDYGNMILLTSNGDYWIDGNLAIAAQEQIAFLRKLYHNELPFRVEHQRLVKDLMIVESRSQLDTAQRRAGKAAWVGG